MLTLLGLHSKCISSTVSDKTITYFVTAGDSKRYFKWMKGNQQSYWDKTV